jgi:hypothetical protein
MPDSKGASKDSKDIVDSKTGAKDFKENKESKESEKIKDRKEFEKDHKEIEYHDAACVSFKGYDASKADCTYWKLYTI